MGSRISDRSVKKSVIENIMRNSLISGKRRRMHCGPFRERLRAWGYGACWKRFGRRKVCLNLLHIISPIPEIM